MYLYINRIIIFSVLFVVVIFCLIYRIYKKRQEEHIESDSPNKNQTNDKKKKGGMFQENGSNENGAINEENGIVEQVKFRGSMSSVENRHERVPSKPVVIAITTPKGTRHVADAFGEYSGKDADKDHELPEIDEDVEQEYIENQNGNGDRNNNESYSDDNNNGIEDKGGGYNNVTTNTEMNNNNNNDNYTMQ